MYTYFDEYPDYLMHHGIKGQKWGLRRFQNQDGSYTEAGRARYGIGDSVKRGASSVRTRLTSAASSAKSGASRAASSVRTKAGEAKSRAHDALTSETAKRAAIGIVSAAAAAGLTYAAMKHGGSIKQGASMVKDIIKGNAPIVAGNALNGLDRAGNAVKRGAGTVKDIVKGNAPIAAGNALNGLDRAGNAVKRGAGKLGNSKAGRTVSSAANRARQGVEGAGSRVKSVVRRANQYGVNSSSPVSTQSNVLALPGPVTTTKTQRVRSAIGNTARNTAGNISRGVRNTANRVADSTFRRSTNAANRESRVTRHINESRSKIGQYTSKKWSAPFSSHMKYEYGNGDGTSNMMKRVVDDSARLTTRKLKGGSSTIAKVSRRKRR